MNPVVNVIHNPKRMDRRVHLQQQVKWQSMEIIIHPATMDEQMPLRGISVSHRKIVQRAKELGSPEVWIGEDDMKFLGDGAFKYFVDHKPQDFDLYLSGIFFGDIVDGCVEDFCGMTLYCVNARFYDKFLSVNPFDNIDRALAYLGRYVVCDPMVTTQLGGFSDHSKIWRSGYDDKLIGRNLYGQP